MKHAFRLLLVALLTICAIRSAEAQSATSWTNFNVEVSPGIRLILEQGLDFDPNTAGNADGFFTTADGMVFSTTPASWAVDGSEGLTVTYEIGGDTFLQDINDPLNTIPLSFAQDAQMQCSDGTYAVIVSPGAPVASEPCDLTSMALPFSNAVVLDGVGFDLTDALPGSYTAGLRLTATIQ